MLDTSVEVSRELKSVLNNLGKLRKFLETLLAMGTAASEVHE